jgi:hypothetical protein
MTNNEASEIIAKYMSYAIRRNGKIHKDDKSIEVIFTKSLDSLIPVWKKIAKDSSRCVDINAFFSDESSCEFSVSYNGWFDESSEWGTAQESAAHATAKAILALEKRNE